VNDGMAELVSDHKKDINNRKLKSTIGRKRMDNLFGVVLIFATVAAWLTHIFTCFADGLWGFLIAGAILFPIGILHGIYLWFN
jgi:divalent metal cation (Fe/Co/Zn/Cd) transporter